MTLNPLKIFKNKLKDGDQSFVFVCQVPAGFQSTNEKKTKENKRK